MSLKSRRQMLLSAQSLWNRISTGYNLIEEKSQELNALRLHIEQTEASIKELESVVGRQEMLCHEKEYTFLLSKSQNVILCATLSDSETELLSRNVVGLKIAFGNVGALASYCAEVEAVGQEEPKKGKLVIFVQ